MIDLQPFYDLLKQPPNLIIFFNFGIGYFVKGMPWIPNKFLETIVLLVSIAVTMMTYPFFHKDLVLPMALIMGFMWGVNYAFISFKSYDFLLSKFENFISSKKSTEPPMKNTLSIPVIILASCLGFNGCITTSTGQKTVDPVAIHDIAKVTSYGFTCWVLSLSKGDASDLSDKKVILARVQSYLLIARDNGATGSEIASGLLAILPKNEHWNSYVDGLNTALGFVGGPAGKSGIQGILDGIDQAVLIF